MSNRLPLVVRSGLDPGLADLVGDVAMMLTDKSMKWEARRTRIELEDCWNSSQVEVVYIQESTLESATSLKSWNFFECRYLEYVATH